MFKRCVIYTVVAYDIVCVAHPLFTETRMNKGIQMHKILGYSKKPPFSTLFT